MSKTCDMNNAPCGQLDEAWGEFNSAVEMYSGKLQAIRAAVRELEDQVGLHRVEWKGAQAAWNELRQVAEVKR